MLRDVPAVTEDALGSSEDGADKSMFASSKHCLYCRMGSILFIFIADALMGLFLHLLWEGDSVCHETPTRHVHGGHLALLVIVLLVHFAYILVFMSENFSPSTQELPRTRIDSSMKLAQVRHWVQEVQSWQATRLLSKHHFNLWYLAVLAGSVAVLAEHVKSCIKLTQAEFNLTFAPSQPYTAAYNATLEEAEAGAVKANIDLLHVQRWHLFIHALRLVNAFVRVLWLEKHLRLSLQTLVSSNKRRFRDKKSDFDLDLSYVCDRLIAMAIPGVQDAICRNDIKDVARFFSTRHYASFCVINLAESFEESYNANYDPALLYGQVQRIPCQDHAAPALKVLIEFCQKATAFLNRGTGNVIAVHCRAGKGRTGTFICALMRWCRVFESRKDCMSYFAQRRTRSSGEGDADAVDEQEGAEAIMHGVDAPSQRTILQYVDLYMESNIDIFAPPRVILSRVTIESLPFYARGGCRMSMVIFDGGGKPVYDHGKARGWLQLAADGAQEFDGHLCAHILDVGGLCLCGDVSIRFYVFEDDCQQISGVTGLVHPGANQIVYGSVRGKCVCFLSLNTSMMSLHGSSGMTPTEAGRAETVIKFAKSEIDGAHADVNSIKFLDSFSISLALTGSSEVEKSLLNKGGPQANACNVNGIYLGLAPAIQEMHLSAVLQQIFQNFSTPREVEEFCKGDVLNSYFGSCEPLSETELERVRRVVTLRRWSRSRGKLTPPRVQSGAEGLSAAGNGVVRIAEQDGGVGASDAPRPLASNELVAALEPNGNVLAGRIASAAVSATLSDVPSAHISDGGHSQEADIAGAWQSVVSVGWIEQGLVETWVEHSVFGPYEEGTFLMWLEMVVFVRV